jgi:hypothetical protein
MRLSLILATTALLLTGCHKQPDAGASGLAARYQHERDQIQALGNGMQQELTREIRNRVAAEQQSRYNDAPMPPPTGLDGDAARNEAAP